MSFNMPFAEGAIWLRTDRVSPEDGRRQEGTAQEILRRLENQPGVILADEVGMGKTFVALGVAASVALARESDGPVVIMVPPSLKEKWPRDWGVFRRSCLRSGVSPPRVAKAESGVAFLKLLDDPPDRRNAIIFLMGDGNNGGRSAVIAVISRDVARKVRFPVLPRAGLNAECGIRNAEWQGGPRDERPKR
jgi:hypothetical protein